MFKKIDESTFEWPTVMPADIVDQAIVKFGCLIREHYEFPKCLVITDTTTPRTVAEYIDQLYNEITA